MNAFPVFAMRSGLPPPSGSMTMAPPGRCSSGASANDTRRTPSVGGATEIARSVAIRRAQPPLVLASAGKAASSAARRTTCRRVKSSGMTDSAHSRKEEDGKACRSGGERGVAHDLVGQSKVALRSLSFAARRQDAEDDLRQKARGRNEHRSFVQGRRVEPERFVERARRKDRQERRGGENAARPVRKHLVRQAVSTGVASTTILVVVVELSEDDRRGHRGEGREPPELVEAQHLPPPRQGAGKLRLPRRRRGVGWLLGRQELEVVLGTGRSLLRGLLEHCEPWGRLRGRDARADARNHREAERDHRFGAPCAIHCAMTSTAAAQIDPGAGAGWPGPYSGSAGSFDRSLVTRKLLAGSPGFTRMRPRAEPRRFAACALTSTPYGSPAKLGPLPTPDDSAA